MSSKSKKVIPMIIMLITGIVIGGYANEAIASGTLQSQGKIVYEDTSTGQEVVLDTNDFKVLQEEIENSNEITKSLIAKTRISKSVTIPANSGVRVDITLPTNNEYDWHLISATHDSVGNIAINATCDAYVRLWNHTGSERTVNLHLLFLGTLKGFCNEI